MAPLSSIGPYLVLRELGAGGMGQVFSCRDEALQREVAVKVLLPDLARDPEMHARFVREARAMARISSPHVVTIFHVGEADVGPYLVMELMRGEDLSDALARGPLDPVTAVSFCLDAVVGLAAAYRTGLVHRDVKPANLFITDGGVKLTDFGLARPLDGSSDLTQAGMIVGTPHYLAPELCRGEEATPQSDMYALGATLFEMLAGRPPYESRSAVEVLTHHLHSPVPDLRSDLPHLAAPLAEMVKKLMQKDPRLRHADYGVLEAELVRIRSALSRGAVIDARVAPMPTMTMEGPPLLDATPAAPAAPIVGDTPRPPSPAEPHATLLGVGGADLPTETAPEPPAAPAPAFGTEPMGTPAVSAPPSAVGTPLQAEGPSSDASATAASSTDVSSPAAPRPRRGRAIALAAALVVMSSTVAAGALAVVMTRTDARFARIASGEADAVVDAIEQTPIVGRTAVDELVLGAAHRATGEERRALDAYQRAAEKGADDQEALAFALDHAARVPGTDAVDVLAAWPGDIDDLLRRSLGGGWRLRRAALESLERRGAATAADHVAVGMLDLVSPTGCALRAEGLRRLAGHAAGDEVAQTMETEAARPENRCLAAEAGGAAEAVRARAAPE